MKAVVKQREIIHISIPGPEYWLSIGSREIRFEENSFGSPIVLDNKTGEPLKTQPDERSVFWLHYETWARQGKYTRTCPVQGKVWCIYETGLQSWRRQLSKVKEKQ